MEDNRITSRKNEKLSEYRLLLSVASERKKTGLFVCEGARLCADAAQSGISVRSLFYTEKAGEKYAGYLRTIRETGCDCFVIEEHIADFLSEVKSPQGIFCIAEKKVGSGMISRDGLYLACEEIQDPANLGTLMRTAEALGISGMLVSEDSCDVYSGKVLRAGMGAAFRLPVLFTENMAGTLRELTEKGFFTCAAVADAEAEKITEITFPAGCVMAVGNEGNGLSPEAVAACTRRVTIPMRGRAQSLNASAAGAILLWEMAKGDARG